MSYRVHVLALIGMTAAVIGQNPPLTNPIIAPKPATPPPNPAGVNINTTTPRPIAQQPLLSGDQGGSSVTSGSGSVEITTVQSISSEMVTTASVNGDPCFDPLADRHVGDATPQPNSTIQVTSSLLEHQKYRVKIASLAGPITFVGFSLQARAVEGLTPVGTWKIDAANDGDISANFVNCKGGSILVSDPSAKPRIEITATWIPPQGFKGQVEFLASLVGPNPQTFWTGIRSNAIDILPQLNATGIVGSAEGPLTTSTPVVTSSTEVSSPLPILVGEKAASLNATVNHNSGCRSHNASFWSGLITLVTAVNSLRY